MGNIKQEVRDQHLVSFPEEEEILKAFLNGFSVTWAKRESYHNIKLSVYFLQPDPEVGPAFGLENELMLVYSSYMTLHAATMQAAEEFMKEWPANGRVENMAYLLVSEASGVEDRISSYYAQNQESRIIVGFDADVLRSKKDDPWFVKGVLERQQFGRDLFDYRFPLERDTYFFGRTDLVSTYCNAIKTSENRALLGLRKTGKTSLLLKVKRKVVDYKIGHFLYYDCSNPAVHNKRWFELLELITREIAAEASIKLTAKYRFDEKHAPDAFMDVVERSKGLGSIALVFDEIEYISPVARGDDGHWTTDFVPFWQTFRSCQTQHRNICTIIAGVNPYVVEVDVVGEVPNPLFGIVKCDFLLGLSKEDTRTMVRTLGGKMGLRFTEDAVAYLDDNYGGHPLLTRIACSLVNRWVRDTGKKKPYDVTAKNLRSQEETRDSDLSFYCRHVVWALSQFYPDEYLMLEWLAGGQVADYVDLAREPESTRHLIQYGLINPTRFKKPSITMLVVERYVAREQARLEGRSPAVHIMSTSQRPSWLRQRVETLVDELHHLDRHLMSTKALGGHGLFGTASFPEADKFVRVSVVTDRDSFTSFINVCNMCFVESIETFGRAISRNDYFWKDIREACPGIWPALHRIKLYRISCDHLKPNPETAEEIERQFHQDIGAPGPNSTDDSFFVLQQCVLDGLMEGIQIDLNLSAMWVPPQANHALGDQQRRG